VQGVKLRKGSALAVSRFFSAKGAGVDLTRRACEDRLLRMAVAAIGATFNALTIQMLVEFGIQYPLR
jgi:hypothetical protein